MVRNINEEEIILRKRARRRLVGAILLVIVAVVFLPMVLDEEPQSEQQEIDIEIPSEELTAENYPWMTLEDGIADNSLESIPEPDKPLPFYQETDRFENAENSELNDQLVASVPVPGRKPVLVKSVAPSLPAQEKITTHDQSKMQEGLFVIQLGAFSDVSKAQQQQQNLVANGIKAYTETINVGGNEMVRVRIGPFPTREAAELEHEQLKKIGLSGVVTTK